jgi:DNA polymerase-3 subunit delta'
MHSWLNQHQHLLSQQIIKVKLPHAILINGVVGAGKSQLSNWLINVLSCEKPVNNQPILSACMSCKPCLLQQSKTYPDHLLIDNDGKSIGVDQVRQASRFFEKTAQLGHCKTTLINAAHTMTVSAANALLKTLEEPNNNNFIVLQTSELDTLLPTIISRCFVIDIRPPVGDALLAELQQSGQDPFVNLSQLSELSNATTNENYQNFSNSFIAFLQGNSANHSDVLSQLNDNKECLRWLEKVMVSLMRQQYNWVQGENPLNEEMIWSIYQIVISATKQIKTLTQVNRQFTFEKILVDISDVIQRK